MGGEDRVQRFFAYASKDEGVKAKERHTKILKSRGKLESTNPNDVWEHNYQRNMTKLAVFVLLYVFSTYDNEISDKELSRIKRFYKKEKKVLTKEDQKDIYQYAIKKVSFEKLSSYMIENELQEKILNEAIQLVKKLIHKETKYLSILSDLLEKYRAV